MPRNGCALPNRPCSLARTRRAVGTALMATIFLSAAGIVSPVPGITLRANATSTGIPTCSAPDVREVVSTSQQSYGPGMMAPAPMKIEMKAWV